MHFTQVAMEILLMYCHTDPFVLVILVLLFHHGSTLYLCSHDFSMVILDKDPHCMSAVVSSFSIFIYLQHIGWKLCYDSLG